MKAILAITLVSFCSLQAFAAPKAVERPKDTVKTDEQRRAEAAKRGDVVKGNEARQATQGDLALRAEADDLNRLAIGDARDGKCNTSCMKTVDTFGAMANDPSIYHGNPVAAQTVAAVIRDAKAIEASNGHDMGAALMQVMTDKGLNQDAIVESCKK